MFRSFSSFIFGYHQLMLGLLERTCPTGMCFVIITIGGTNLLCCHAWLVQPNLSNRRSLLDKLCSDVSSTADESALIVRKSATQEVAWGALFLGHGLAHIPKSFPSSKR